MQQMAMKFEDGSFHQGNITTNFCIQTHFISLISIGVFLCHRLIAHRNLLLNGTKFNDTECINCPQKTLIERRKTNIKWQL